LFHRDRRRRRRGDPVADGFEVGLDQPLDLGHRAAGQAQDKMYFQAFHPADAGLAFFPDPGREPHG
jgi:hypothetical protein